LELLLIRAEDSRQQLEFQRAESLQRLHELHLEHAVEPAVFEREVARLRRRIAGLSGLNARGILTSL